VSASGVCVVYGLFWSVYGLFMRLHATLLEGGGAFSGALLAHPWGA